MKVIVQKSEKAIKTFRLLSNLTIKNIINFLKNGPDSPSAIARGVNISPSTASRCLQELKKYDIVSAKWKMISVDERPLKIYTLVPNILRFEFVLNEPDILKPNHLIKFVGSSLVDFKEEDKKGIYTSMDSVPFRFDSLEAEVLKEITKGVNKFEDLKSRFENQVTDLNIVLRKFLTLGLIELEAAKK